MFELMMSAGNTKKSTAGPDTDTLAYGDSQLGYYGEVDYKNIIAGDQLASQVGVPSNKILNPTPNWLKYAYQGKILYIAMLPIANGISWTTLYNLGLIKDTLKQLTIGDRKFNIRVMDETEWSALFARVHTSNTIQPIWASYNDKALGVGPAPGHGTWLQNSVSGNSQAVFRGYSSIGDRAVTPTSETSSILGWRPVLELIN